MEKIEYPEKGISLISKHNKSVMASCRMDSHSIFVLTAGNAYHYGIDTNGFFILEKRKENDLENFYVVFRSKNFIQSYVRENMFQFTDIATIFHFECSVSLEFNENNPTELYEFIIQESEIDQISNFSVLIAKLKKLAKASMKTGNPIHWA